jgi:hypothetical protein
MAKPGIMNRTKAVEINIQAVVPVSTAWAPAAQASGLQEKKNRKKTVASFG